MPNHNQRARITVLAVTITLAMMLGAAGRCLGQSDGALTVYLLLDQDVGVAFGPTSLSPSPGYSPQGGTAFNVTVMLIPPTGYYIDASSDPPQGDPSSIWSCSATTGLVTSQTWQGVGVADATDWADVYFAGTLVPIPSGTGPGTLPSFAASVADMSIYVAALPTDNGTPQVSGAEHYAETEGVGAYLPSAMITTGTSGFPTTLPTGSNNYTLIARVKPPQWIGATDVNGNVGNLTFSPPPGVAIYDSFNNLVAQPSGMVQLIGVPPNGLQATYYLLTDQNFTGASPITADFTWTAPNASGYAQDYAPWNRLRR